VKRVIQNITVWGGMLISICILLQGQGQAQTMTAPRDADTGKKCAICHYRWVYTFFVEHRGTPLAPLNEDRDTVADKDMCLSCHDGSVMDSRDKICNDPGHKTGVVPSARVTIPRHFPLDARGAMTCGTCHTPHAVAPKKGSLVTSFLRGTNANSSFCRECHQNNTGGAEQGNHPLDVSAKAGADIITRAGGRFGTEQPHQIICETCHIAHGGVNSSFLVMPVESTEAKWILCEVCHTKNPGKGADAGGKRYSHPLDKKPGTSVQIPQTWSSGEKVVLGQSGELVCRTCHKPHQAGDKKFLLADQAQGSGLCMQCHRGKAPVADSRHNLALSAPEEIRRAGSRGHSGGPCESCHLVHEGRGPFMWARNLPAGARGADGLCRSCHAQGQCAAKKLPKDFSHPLGAAVPDTAARGGLPLFTAAGVRSATGTMGCATCHDVHNPAPVTAAGPGGKQGLFLRMGSQGASAHCLACHPDQSLVEGTAHDMSAEKPGYKNMLGRTPGQSGLCGTCHAAHGAPEKKYMWAAPLAERFPADGKEQQAGAENIVVRMCAGCHQAGGIAQKHAPAIGLHPAAFYCAAAGQGKNLCDEGISLFDGQGKRTDEGAVVCATCHNAHRWGGRKTADGKGPGREGTALTSFLRDGVAEQFCTACHGTKALFNYLYFHTETGRKARTKPFPFQKR